MIVNPGINAYPMRKNEIEKFEHDLGRIFCNPEIECLIKYGLGGYKEGVSDVDLLALTRKTVTDKKVLSQMGEKILELYESLGEVRGISKGTELDLSVYDTPTFSRYGLTSFDRAFPDLFENEKCRALAGEYPKGIKFSKDADRTLLHIAKNLSLLRTFPLLKGVIVRFRGRDELGNIRQTNVTKITDLPYAVFSYVKGKKPDSREEAVEYLESNFNGVSHEPLIRLLKAKGSFSDKMDFLNSSQSDEVLLDGITWFEGITEGLLTKDQTTK